LTTLGIIGCGYWGPNLVRNFHGLPAARVKTVSDLRPGRLDFIRENYPDIETTSDFETIINDPEIDAVAVVTPVTTHREIAELALRAGKHVFVEKPLAHTGEDAWALVELAERLGRTLAVGHIFQFAPGVRRMKQEIESGTLGKVFHVDSTRINLGPPKTTVDVVWDLAPHDLSIILYLLDEMPDRVSASGRSYQWNGHIDNAHIDLGFPSGATAHVHVGWLSAEKTRLTRLFAERGSMVYDEMLALDGKVKLYGKGVDNRVNATDNDSGTLGYSAGEIRVLQLEQHEPLRLECAEFVRACATGSSLPNDGAMGAKVVELLEWISQEISGGITVTVPANGSLNGKVIENGAARW
jgi:predicted dehydrogenase